MHHRGPLHQWAVRWVHHTGGADGNAHTHRRPNPAAIAHKNADRDSEWYAQSDVYRDEYNFSHASSEPHPASNGDHHTNRRGHLYANQHGADAYPDTLRHGNINRRASDDCYTHRRRYPYANC
jgi:hypothetical protein